MATPSRTLYVSSPLSALPSSSLFVSSPPLLSSPPPYPLAEGNGSSDSHMSSSLDEGDNDNDDEDEDEVEDQEEDTTPSRRQSSSSTPKLDEKERLDHILRYMKKQGLTARKFMEALGRHQKHPHLRRPYGAFLEYMVGPGWQASKVNKHTRKEYSQRCLDSWGWQAAADQIGAELRELMKCPSFQTFQTSTEEDKIRSVDLLCNAMPDISAKAPRFVALLERACGKKGPRPDLSRRYAVILSILTHHKSPKKSNLLQSALGLYVYQGGARRRVIDCLGRLGLTLSYPTLLRQQESMSKSAIEKVRSVGAGSDAIVTYDNFDFAEGRRGERAGDTQQFRSITTALTFPGQMIPPGGLNPNMWRPHISLNPISVATQLSPDIWNEVRPIVHPQQLLY